MNLLQVVKRNSVLTLPGPLLDPVGANFGRALNIDNPSQINDLIHLNQLVIELQVDRMLSLVQNLAVFHNASKDVSVGE